MLKIWIFSEMLTYEEQVRLLTKIQTTNFLKRSGWVTRRMTGAETFEAGEKILGQADYQALIKMKTHIGKFMSKLAFKYRQN